MAHYHVPPPEGYGSIKRSASQEGLVDGSFHVMSSFTPKAFSVKSSSFLHSPSPTAGVTTAQQMPQSQLQPQPKQRHSRRVVGPTVPLMAPAGDVMPSEPVYDEITPVASASRRHSAAASVALNGRVIPHSASAKALSGARVSRSRSSLPVNQQSDYAVPTYDEPAIEQPVYSRPTTQSQGHNGIGSSNGASRQQHTRSRSEHQQQPHQHHHHPRCPNSSSSPSAPAVSADDGRNPYETPLKMRDLSLDRLTETASARQQQP